ncbi:replication-associated recombination protein A [Actinomycetospora sp. SF1]|nr:replication-associated recombination protein A [Actinomycetospora soli]MCD2187693.1 replication-associated recombination protein A [Actinomycetospora soli]
MPAGNDVRPPLAVRMRPASLDEVVGQDHLLAPGAPLRRLVEGAAPASVLLHGPPGTGKTTLARLISQATGRAFEALSALSAGVKEVRGVIEVARRRLAASDPRRTVLFIDEIHRFSRTQQDALLGAVEDRVVLLVGATTENPSFSVVAPLLSRSLVLGLHALGDDAVATLLDRAVADDRGLAGTVTLTDEARAHLVRLAAGDGRRSLTALEAAADAVGDGGTIDLAVVEQVVDEVAVRYDRAGDQHYDVISAFIKSIRGSDPDAALHYLARMIVAGEDPRFIARRLVVHASEDVGLADPTALQAATAAAQAVQLIGLPECRIALAQATIHLATAPKSNAVITAIDAAMSDVRSGAAGPVPPHLRDGHYAGAQKLGNAVGYRYPHDERSAVVTQQYPPDELVGRDYYAPSGRGEERAIGERLARLREVIRGR